MQPMVPETLGVLKAGLGEDILLPVGFGFLQKRDKGILEIERRGVRMRL